MPCDNPRAMRTCLNRPFMFTVVASLLGLGALAGPAIAATPPSGSPATAGAGGATAPPVSGRVAVTLANPLAVARAGETIALGAAALAKVVPGCDVKKALVLDPPGGPVLSQVLDEDGDEAADELVFQPAFAAKETK